MISEPSRELSEKCTDNLEISIDFRGYHGLSVGISELQGLQGFQSVSVYFRGVRGDNSKCFKGILKSLRMATKNSR